MTEIPKNPNQHRTGGQSQAVRGGSFAPLRERAFRRIWTTSLLAIFGQLILGVGVAWEMTRLTSSASMVALVQTAMMLPLMLVALPAGAIADMFDRRKIAMLGLGIAAIFGSELSTLAFLEPTNPVDTDRILFANSYQRGSPSVSGEGWSDRSALCDGRWTPRTHRETRPSIWGHREMGRIKSHE